MINAAFKIIFYLAILATSLPVGLLLAWLCEDELVNDRKYFFAMMWLALLIMIVNFLFFFNPAIIFSLFYFILVMLILIRRSKRIEAENRIKGKKKR
jgi:hypothetical protein